MKQHQVLTLLLTAGLLSGIRVSATDTLTVRTFRHEGPLATTAPHRIDSINVDGKTFDPKTLLESPSGTALVGSLSHAVLTESVPREAGLHLLGFSVENRRFAKAQLLLEGISGCKLYVDGEAAQPAALKLEPGTHDFVLKYLVSEQDSSTVEPSVRITSAQALSLREDGQRIFSLDLNTQGESCSWVSVSPGGRYYVVGHSLTGRDGKGGTWFEMVRRADGQVIGRQNQPYSWVPVPPAPQLKTKRGAKSAASPEERYWYTRSGLQGRDLILADPETGGETVWASDIPEGRFDFVPGGRYLVYSLSQKGPKEGEVHQILTPDDRQPGWRDRGYLALYDRFTGLLEPLTWGWHNVRLSDISPDGSTILFQTSEERLSQRPTTLYSLYVMDLATRQTDCIVERDGFLNGASFSPDGSEILVTASPEAFDGIGKDVLPDQTPNMFDLQLYAVKLADRSVRPLTKDFAPSILQAAWSRFDGKVYATAEDKDCKNLFRIDPVTAAAERLPNREENLSRFSLADSAPILVYSGQSLCNGDRVYLMDTRSLAQECVQDISARRF